MKVKSFMKNTWHLLACLMLLVACSDDKVEDETTITLPPETETLFEKGVNFTTSAGTQSLEFTATENWNITAATTRNGEKWYQVYPTSGGPGKAEISISVEDNDSYDERSVAITINAGKTKKTLMVAQKQKNALLISSERREVKQEGGTIDVEVEANVEYKAIIADDCQSWIKPAASTTTRGLKASTISFKIEMNGEREKREGEIYITDGTLTETVKVYQYGGDVILLNENEYPVGDRGETIKVELRSNCEYGITMPDVSLGELTLGYDIPINKWCKWISGLNVSFVGRNLWMLYCKAPFDPESTASTGTYNQGMDYFMQPSLRSMGFSAKISF